MKWNEPRHEKTCLCITGYVNNQDTDQPAHLRSLISVFVIRCLDSSIPVFAMSKVSRLWLASVAEQTIWVLPGQKPQRQVLSWRGSNNSLVKYWYIAWSHPTSAAGPKTTI